MCVGLQYNYEDIKPFLCKPKVNEVNAKSLLFGEARYETDINSDGRYLYHVTRLGNLKSIIKNNLSCTYGSNGGIGELMAGRKFEKHEKEFLFATKSPKIVDRYIYNYDELADGVLQPKMGNYTPIEAIPILLRFEPNDNEIWIADKKQKDAVKGKNTIESSRLDFLSYEGWVSLKSQKAQNTVCRIISEILI